MHHCVSRSATPLMFYMLGENIWSCDVCAHIQQRFILSTSRLRLNPVLPLAPWPLGPSPLARLGVWGVPLQMNGKGEVSGVKNSIKGAFANGALQTQRAMRCFPEYLLNLLLQQRHATVFLLRKIEMYKTIMTTIVLLYLNVVSINLVCAFASRTLTKACQCHTYRFLLFVLFFHPHASDALDFTFVKKKPTYPLNFRLPLSFLALEG